MRAAARTERHRRRAIDLPLRVRAAHRGERARERAEARAAQTRERTWRALRGFRAGQVVRAARLGTRAIFASTRMARARSSRARRAPSRVPRASARVAIALGLAATRDHQQYPKQPRALVHPIRPVPLPTLARIVGPAAPRRKNVAHTPACARSGPRQDQRMPPARSHSLRLASVGDRIVPSGGGHSTSVFLVFRRRSADAGDSPRRSKSACPGVLYPVFAVRSALLPAHLLESTALANREGQSAANPGIKER